MLQAAEARLKLQMAIATGPACGGQEAAAIVRRSISFACIRNGFDANTQAGDRHYAYKLHCALVAQVGEHAREPMDSFGFAGQSLDELLELVEFK